MCARCRYFKLDPSDKLSRHGFGNCAHLPAWRYRSRLAACDFNPSRYREAQ